MGFFQLWFLLAFTEEAAAFAADPPRYIAEEITRLACEDWRGRNTRKAAARGEAGALRCRVASELSLAYALDLPYNPDRWFEIGYVHTRIIGEPSPWAMDAAPRLSQREVLWTIGMIEREAGQIDPFVDFPVGCWKVNPIQMKFVALAQASRHAEICGEAR